MIVLLFSVMAGLAALARGVLFTAAVCLALVVSVAVLVGSLRLARAVGGPAWLPGVLAILAFVLVVGGPAYLLAIRDGPDPGAATPDDQGSGDDSTGDTKAGDSDAGGSEQAVDEGATPGPASPLDAGASEDLDEETEVSDVPGEHTDPGDRNDRSDADDHTHSAIGSTGRTPDAARSTGRSVGDGLPDGRDGEGDRASPGTPGG